MPEQRLLTKQEICKRWAISASTVDRLTREGVLSQVPALSCCRFNLQQIEEIESAGLKLEPFSPLERRKMEKEIERLSVRCRELELAINNATNSLKGVS